MEIIIVVTMINLYSNYDFAKAISANSSDIDPLIPI